MMQQAGQRDHDHHHHARTLRLRDVLSLEIVCPPIQRAVDPERVGKIVSAHLGRIRRGLTPVFLGVLQLVPAAAASSAAAAPCYALLDGQHRLAAMRRLAAEADAMGTTAASAVQDAPVHVEIIPVERLGMTPMEAFQAINQSVPVPEYVVQGAMDRGRRDALDDFKRRFAGSEFAGFLSPARAPRRPNINLEQFVDRLARETALVDACAATGDAMMAYVRWANARMRALLKSDCGDGDDAGVLHRATDKARRLRLGPDAAFVLTADERWMSAAWVADYCLASAPPLKAGGSHVILSSSSAQPSSRCGR